MASVAPGPMPRREDSDDEGDEVVLEAVEGLEGAPAGEDVEIE